MPNDPSRLCVCHGEPMYRQPSTDEYACQVKRREAKRRYEATEKGLQARRARGRRYMASEKGRAVQHRYKTSEKGRRAAREWAKTPKGRAAMKRVDERRIRVDGMRVRTFKTAEAAQTVKANLRTIKKAVLQLDKERSIA